jgi:hypothetical protein
MLNIDGAWTITEAEEPYKGVKVQIKIPLRNMKMEKVVSLV